MDKLPTPPWRLHRLQRVRVQKLRDHGHTLQEIADLYGCSRQAVSQMLKRIQSDVDSDKDRA